jgi:hypothetical protein
MDVGKSVAVRAQACDGTRDKNVTSHGNESSGQPEHHQWAACVHTLMEAQKSPVVKQAWVAAGARGSRGGHVGEHEWGRAHQCQSAQDELIGH